MKLLMVVVPEVAESDIRTILDEAGSPGWTEVRNLVGRGESGLRLGNQIWPGHNSAFLCAVQPELVDGVCRRLNDYRIRHQGPAGTFPIRLFSIPCEVLI